MTVTHKPYKKSLHIRIPMTSLSTFLSLAMNPNDLKKANDIFVFYVSGIINIILKRRTTSVNVSVADVTFFPSG